MFWSVVDTKSRDSDLYSGVVWNVTMEAMATTASKDSRITRQRRRTTLM